MRAPRSLSPVFGGPWNADEVRGDARRAEPEQTIAGHPLLAADHGVSTEAMLKVSRMRCQAVGPCGAARPEADRVIRWLNGPCLFEAPARRPGQTAWHTDRFHATPPPLGGASEAFCKRWTPRLAHQGLPAGRAMPQGSPTSLLVSPSGATEQALQADEAPLEVGRGMVVGRERGSVVTVWVPASSGASQLKRGVLRTCGVEERGETS